MLGRHKRVELCSKSTLNTYGMEQFRRKNSPDPHIHMSLTKEARERAIQKSEVKRGAKVEYIPMSREDSL